MIKNMYIGAQKAVKAYLGDILVWQAPPKLTANFTTGEYKASGAAKTFAEVFTFNRAGKAWLVKDTGLVEYAVDTPRFDNGLLIEQSATNYVPSYDKGYTGSRGTSTVLNDNYLGKAIRVTNISSNGSGLESYAFLYSANPKPNVFSAYMYTEQNTNFGFGVEKSVQTYCRYNPVSKVVTNNSSLNTVQTEEYKQWVRVSVTTLAENEYDLHTPFTDIPQDSDDNPEVFYFSLRQAEFDIKSSPVISTTAPVTRPADFLKSKVTGTTITGDWDSTLTLSIVDGQIVHSGYGRIRSLEIS